MTTVNNSHFGKILRKTITKPSDGITMKKNVKKFNHYVDFIFWQQNDNFHLQLSNIKLIKNVCTTKIKLKLFNFKFIQ